LDSVAVWFLLSIAILSAAWFFVKPHRSKISLVLVVVASAYVFSGLYSIISEKGKLGKSSSVIDADRAELLLKFGSAISSADKVLGKQTPADEKQLHKFLDEADKALDKICQNNPNNAGALARQVILKHQMKEPITQPLEQLQHADPVDGPALAKDLSLAYCGHVSAADANAIENDLTRRLPAGWYRNHALGALYRSAAEAGKLKALQDSETEHNVRMLFKMALLVSVVGVSGLVGVIVILVQLIFLGRKVTPEEEENLVRAPAAYGFKAVYGVFVAWLATELTVTFLAQNLLHGVKLMQLSVILAALTTTALYLFTNGPGLLYAYFFALKPHGIKFLEGLKFRTHVGKLGPRRMVLIGLLTWMAALPLVVVAYLIAMKYFGSEGSSNPIIALVMETARSANLAATLIFYFTIGVLAPICEESLFRGFLYSALRRRLSVLPSMLISALVFAGAHLDAGGFLPLFVLGVVFAFVFEKTKSTLPSMVAHGLWNSGTFTLVLLLFGN